MTIFYKQLRDDFLTSAAEIGKLFSSTFDESTEVVIPKILPIGEVYKKIEKDKITFKTNIAGMKKEHIHINIVDNKLVIDVRELDIDEKPDIIYFFKQLPIKDNYDLSNIKSKYENGILEICVPLIYRTHSSIIVE